MEHLRQIIKPNPKQTAESTATDPRETTDPTPQTTESTATDPRKKTVPTLVHVPIRAVQESQTATEPTTVSKPVPAMYPSLYKFGLDYTTDRSGCEAEVLVREATIIDIYDYIVKYKRRNDIALGTSA